MEEHTLWHRMIRSKDGGAESGWDTKPLLRRSNRIPSKNVCQPFDLYWDVIRRWWAIGRGKLDVAGISGWR